MTMREHMQYMQGFYAYCDGKPEPEDALQGKGWRAARLGETYAMTSAAHIEAGGCPLDADRIARSITMREALQA